MLPSFLDPQQGPFLDTKEPPQTGSFYSKALLIYLLVMNIVLTVVVIALVYHAVAAMYFKTP